MPTVLILDDDPAQLQLCRMILQSLQCRIVTTQSSDEALRLLTTVKPDVLILDFLMPQVNGVDFLLSLRQDDQFKGLRVLGLTAAPDLVESARNSDLPLWDMLMKKPFEIDKLRKAVQGLLTPKT